MPDLDAIIASANAIYVAIRDMPASKKSETVTAEFAEHYNSLRKFALEAMPEFREGHFPPQIRIATSAQIGRRFTESFYVDVAAYALDIRNRAVNKKGEE